MAKQPSCQRYPTVGLLIASHIALLDFVATSYRVAQRATVAGVELRQTRNFVAIAEDQQFSKAAARLGIAQSTISEQIRVLEDSIGAELLLRSSRSLRLTPAGGDFTPAITSVSYVRVPALLAPLVGRLCGCAR
jgi:hypothetical protein